jgi:hypothetical protein
MDIFSHLLWVYVPFRNKLWRDEALFFAALPDIGTALIFGYILLGTPMHVGFWKALVTMPPVLFHIYYATHSFVTLGVVALIVWRLRPKLLGASFLALFLVYIYTLHRERRRHLTEDKRDWLGDLAHRVDALINRKPIPAYDAAQGDNRGSPDGLFTKDRAGPGKGQTITTDPVKAEGDGRGLPEYGKDLF